MGGPRNVINYRVQETPDSCQVCNKRYTGMTSGLGCSLACSNPKKPFNCDQVSRMGICDAFARGDPVRV